MELWPVLAVASAAGAVGLLPVLPAQGGFEGDLILLLALMEVPSICIIAAGFSSRSIFAEIGSAREAVLSVAYNVVFILAILSIAAAQGTFRLDALAQKPAPPLEWLDGQLAARAISAQEIIRLEHQAQAALNVSVRNLITSMRLVLELDWKEFFETTSLVEAVLRASPVYADLDFASRDAYRHAIEDLARGAGIPELEAAERAVKAAAAREHSAIPLQLRDDNRTLMVAVSDPLNVQLVDTLRAVANCRIVVQIAGRSQIDRAITRFYEGEGDASDFEGSFKVVDSAGRTVVKAIPTAPEPSAPPIRTPASDTFAVGPSGSGKTSALELLKSIEEVQRKEVSALKAMVELMIEKGVFTRDEYLAKVRR